MRILTYIRRGETLYNLITVKSDILELGDLKLYSPKYNQIFNRNGLYVYERYRIYEEKHELTFMLAKNEEKQFYLIATDASNPKNRTIESYRASSLLPDIRYLDKYDLQHIKNTLKKHNVGAEHESIIPVKNSEFKNNLQIYILGMNIKYIALFIAIMVLIVILYQL